VNQPSDELLGEILLAERRPAEAARAFEDELTRAKNRTASILGLARSLRAAGQTAEAARAYGRLVSIWHAADPDLPGLAEARRED
jgi:predicted Zn-dependent protease